MKLRRGCVEMLSICETRGRAVSLVFVGGVRGRECQRTAAAMVWDVMW